MNTKPVFWFTGLSGAGKSTVAKKAQDILRDYAGVSALIIDGDQIRAEYPMPLGFSTEDIQRHSRNVVLLCKSSRKLSKVDALFVSTISPLRDARQEARQELAPSFFEVHFDAPIEVVVARDPKGLYSKASRGNLPDLIGYTGIPYEAPSFADLRIRMDGQSSVEESTAVLVDYVLRIREGR